MEKDLTDAQPPLDPPEPRWPALVAFLAIGGMYLALPPQVSVGPRWLPVAIVAVASVAVALTHHRGMRQANQFFGLLFEGILTVILVWSVILLILALPSGKEAPVKLLKSAALLWISNVLIFALWYWRLDAGGPNARDLRNGHPSGAFLFPQMMFTPEQSSESSDPAWSPQFMDYLFLAFNTSTAFSPTDVPVLSRWAKGLMMVQSAISLAIIAILAARAVNILGRKLTIMKHGLILYFAVGAAGFIGAIARLFISMTSPRLFGPGFPFGTLIINVTGSFIFGWFWRLTSPAGRWSVPDTVRLTVLVGFVGSYTTFSTYVFDSHQFLEQGSWLKAGANLIGSLILGLLAIQLGMRVAGR